MKKSIRSLKKAVRRFGDKFGSRRSLKLPKGRNPQLEKFEDRLLLSISPSVTGASTVDEGAIYQVELSATGDAVAQWDIAWGDGLTSTGTTSDWGDDITYDGQAGTWTATHVYPDNYATDRSVVVTAYDSATPANDYSPAQPLSVTVDNVAPTLTVTSDGMVNQEVTVEKYAPLVIEGTITDPGFTSTACGTNENFDYLIDWGDSSTATSGSIRNLDGSPGVLTEGTFEEDHFYSQTGTYTVTVTAWDDDMPIGEEVTTTFDVEVVLVPEIALSGDWDIDEGSEYTLGIELLNPAVDPIAELTIDWGHGPVTVTAPTPGAYPLDWGNGITQTSDTTWTATYTYPDDGTFAIQVWADKNTADEIWSYHPPISGDINCDGVVNDTDMNILSIAFQQPGTWGWRDGDLDGDGDVDGTDFGTLATAYFSGDTFATSPGQLTVNNVIPTLDITVEGMVDQEVTVETYVDLEILGTITDPGFKSSAAGTYEDLGYSINWGDGSPVVVGSISLEPWDPDGVPGVLTEGIFAQDHYYESTGTYTVTVKAWDDDMMPVDFVTTTFNVEVVVVPELVLTGDWEVNEGSEYTLGIELLNPAVDPIAELTIDWGHGPITVTAPTPGAYPLDWGNGITQTSDTTWTATYTYPDDGIFAIQVWADKDTADEIWSYHPPILGDTNSDGVVDQTDLNIFSIAFEQPGDWNWRDGDFDGDGDVDLSDLGLFAGSLGTTFDPNDGQLTVNNVIPTLDITVDGMVNQEVTVEKYAPLVIQGTITDPGFTFSANGTWESFNYSINWGDGSSATSGYIWNPDGTPGVLTEGTFEEDHFYTSTGTYTVTVRAWDDDMTPVDFVTTTFDVEVIVVPKLVLTGDWEIDEGSEYTLGIELLNPAVDPIAELTIDWGHGPVAVAAPAPGAYPLDWGNGITQTSDTTWTATYTYPDDGTFAIQVWADKDTADEIWSYHPPISGDANSDGVVDQTDNNIVSAHWGQTGMSWQQGDFNGDGTVNTIDLGRLTDNWEATFATRPGQLTVDNVAPTLTIAVDGMVGQEVTIEKFVDLEILGTITDPGFKNTAAGAHENLGYSINWGDGSSEVTGSIDQYPWDPDGTPGVLTEGTFAEDHYYVSTGTYTVTVKAWDDDMEYWNGDFVSTTFDVEVIVVPELALSGDWDIDEGSEYTLGIELLNPAVDPIGELTIDWGHGPVTVTAPTPGAYPLDWGNGITQTSDTTWTATYTYPDDGTFAIQVWADKDTADEIWSYHPPILGDTNCDGVVDQTDINLMSPAYDQPGIWGWRDGDFNGDGNVDMDDFTYIGANWGETFATSPGQLTVNNVAPTLTIAVDGMVDQEVTIEKFVDLEILGTITDPGFKNTAAGAHENLGYSINWGDGSSEVTGSIDQYPWDPDGTPGVLTEGTFAEDHYYASTGTYTVTVKAWDDDMEYWNGDFVSTTFDVEVIVVPELALTGDWEIDEGSQYTLGIELLNPAVDPVAELTIDWGHGPVTVTAPTPGAYPLDWGSGITQTSDTTWTATYTYPDDGTFAIQVWTDKDTADEIWSYHPPILGDTNCDGVVDQTDVNAMSPAYNEPGDWGWRDGDFNGDGNVDSDDFTYIGANWGDTFATSPGQLTVNNVVPTLTIAVDGMVDQEVTVEKYVNLEILGTITDPGFSSLADGTQERFGYSINWGDGSSDSTGYPHGTNGSPGVLTEMAFEGKHGYTETGTYTVTVSVWDDDMPLDEEVTETFDVEVFVVPELELNGDWEVDEGSEYTLDIELINPANPIAELTIDWGHGPVAVTAPTPGAYPLDWGNGITQTSDTTWTASYTYPDDGSFAIQVWADKDTANEIWSYHAPVIGDVNGDGVTDYTDLNIMSDHYGQMSGCDWHDGDMDGDGDVSPADFGILAGSIGTTFDPNDGQFTVNNVAPTLTIAVDGMVDQEVTVEKYVDLEILGTLTDPGFSSLADGTQERLGYSINWGDGSPDSTGYPHGTNGSPGVLTEMAFEGKHGYTETGTYTVTVSVWDDDMPLDEEVTETFDVEVFVVPKLELNGDWDVDEGSEYTLDIELINPANPIAELTIDWGHGPVTVTAPTPGAYPLDWGNGITQTSDTTWTASYTYPDDGSFAIQVWADKDTANEIWSYHAPVIGDVNGDGVTDYTDLNIMSDHYGQMSGCDWHDGDMDGDGDVSPADFGILAGSIGTTFDPNDGQFTVNNVAPTLTLAVDGMVDQEVTVEKYVDLEILGTITDPGFSSLANGTQERFGYLIDWGDGSSYITGYPHGTNGSPGVLTEMAFEGKHGYTETGTYTVTVSVWDDDMPLDEEVTETFDVEVFVVPELELNGDWDVDEGSEYTLDIELINPANPIAELTIDWGHGPVTVTAPTSGAYPLDWGNGITQTSDTTWTASYTYPDDGSFAIQVWADKDTADEIWSYHAPVIGDVNGDGVTDYTDFNILSDHYGQVGGCDWHDGDLTGDGNVDVADFSILGINMGTTFDPNDGQFTVNNVAPTLTLAVDGMVGQEVTIEKFVDLEILGTITDPGFKNSAAGAYENLGYSINWGDGSSEVTGSIDQFPWDPDGTPGVLSEGTFTEDHYYASTGTYTVTVKAWDDDMEYWNGDFVSTTFDVEVIVVPELALTGDWEIDEGSQYTLGIELLNPAVDPVAELTIDWGHGPVTVTAPTPGAYPLDWGNGITQTSDTTWTATYTYPDDGTFAIQVWTDKNTADEIWSYHPPIPGDTNSDGVVEQTDSNLMFPAFGQPGTWGWRDGDFDGDSDVDSDDFLIFSEAYFAGATFATSPGQLTVNNVAPTLASFSELLAYPQVPSTFTQSADNSSLYVHDDTGLLPMVAGYSESGVGDDYVISGEVTYDAMTELGFLARADLNSQYGYVLSLDPTNSYFNLIKLTGGGSFENIANHLITGLRVCE